MKSIEDLNRECVKAILSNLSYRDAWNFGIAIPVLQEGADAHWASITQINLDTVRDKDAEIVIEALQRCKNLRKITLKHNKNDIFKSIPKILETYCRRVEIVNIKQLDLTEEDLVSLSSLTTLRDITFCIDTYSSVLKELFVNNPRIVNVNINCYIEDDSLFDTIPKTIENLTLDETNEWYDTLFPNIETWQLETLNIPCIYATSEEIRSLAKQSKLKYLHLGLICEDSDLELLFTNNPNLETVCLQTDIPQVKGFCLRKLPKTLKKLSLTQFYALQNEDLYECIRDCNLEHLSITCACFMQNYLTGVAANAPNLITLEVSCEFCSSEDLSSIKQLVKLKKLTLEWLKPEHQNALLEIFQNCLSLEYVDIRGFEDVTFTPEIFAAIGRLPKLKNILLLKINCTERVELFNNLASNPSVIGIHLAQSPWFTNEDIMILIRGVKERLEHLTITENNNITIDLVKQIVVELDTQSDRKKRLKLFASGANVLPKEWASVKHRYLCFTPGH